MAALTPLLSTPSQSTVSASACKIEFRHGKVLDKGYALRLSVVLVL